MPSAAHGDVEAVSDAASAYAGGARFVLGLSLALANCLLSSVGYTMTRKAKLLADEQNKESAAQGWWLARVGVSLYILAALPDVFSYMLVPQVICTTVACFRLVLVTALAHVFLREEMQAREVIGMVICTVGTFFCLVFGPKPEDLDSSALGQEFYHPQVWTYLSISLAVLLVLLVVEHSGDQFEVKQPVHYAILPIATGLAFAVEKVFNTELGFVQTPAGVSELLHSPLWCCMVLAIALLGLLDLYLNMRGAAHMPVQVFLPTAFAFATSLQFFQSVVIFGEFAEMTPVAAALSITGAVVSLGGTLLIKPLRLDLLEHKPLPDDAPTDKWEFVLE